MAEISIGSQVRYNVGRGHGIGKVISLSTDGMAQIKTRDGHTITRRVKALKIHNK